MKKQQKTKIQLNKFIINDNYYFKVLKTKITRQGQANFWLIIILLILIGLGIGIFLAWKNISLPKISIPGVQKEEEAYIYKGIWTPTLLLQDQNYLSTHAQKLKDLGINTVFIMAPGSSGEEWLERAREDFKSSPGLIKKLEEVLPKEKEIIIGAIQDAHQNGLKIGLTVVTWNPPLGMKYNEKELNAKIIEYAKLAEEYDVELFAPMGEPQKVFADRTSVWLQEILPKVREVYHGVITTKEPGTGLPQNQELTDEFFNKLSRQPPGQFVGYDYVGFSPMIRPEIQTLEEYSFYVENALKYILAQAKRDGCKGVIITEFGVLDGHFLNQEDSARAHEIVLELAKDYDEVVGFFANSDFLGLDIAGVPEFSIKENLKTQEVIKKYFREILPDKR